MTDRTQIQHARTVDARLSLRIPVLMYHNIGLQTVGARPELTLPPAQFEREMRWLARRGYMGIRPSDWRAWLEEGKPLPKKPVLLTFDDGCMELTTYALPVLRRYGFSGVVYVVTGLLGSRSKWMEEYGSGTFQMMSSQQICEWAAQGIEFGAHTRTHANLTTLSALEVADEIEGSAHDLARLLGFPPVSFAYPFGYYNELAYECVRRTFALAFSVIEGLNDAQTDPWLIRRTMVQPGEGLIDLAGRVRYGHNPLHPLRKRLSRTEWQIRCCADRIRERVLTQFRQRN